MEDEGEHVGQWRWPLLTALVAACVLGLVSQAEGKVPTWALTALALAPLALGLAAVGVVRWRRVADPSVRESVGALCLVGAIGANVVLGEGVGGAFWSSVAVPMVSAPLLLAVAWLTRTKLAYLGATLLWVAVALRAFDAWETAETGWLRAEGFTALGMVALGACVGRFWRMEGSEARDWRVLGALAETVLAALLASQLSAWVDDGGTDLVALAVWWLGLLVATLVERGLPSRPLCLGQTCLLLFGLIPGLALTLPDSSAGALPACPWWLAGPVTVATAVAMVWVWRDEGMLLLLAPACLVASATACPAVAWGGVFAVGAGMVAQGLARRLQAATRDGLAVFALMVLVAEESERIGMAACYWLWLAILLVWVATEVFDAFSRGVLHLPTTKERDHGQPSRRRLVHRPAHRPNGRQPTDETAQADAQGRDRPH